jgi:hypothetical protein
MAWAAAREGAVGPCAGVSETGLHTVVADKGYHSRDSVRALAEAGVQTILSEPERGRQHWRGQAAERQAVYPNRRRLPSSTGKKLLRGRGEYLERAGTHLYDRGVMRRVHLRGKQNVAKKALVHATFNLSLILRVVLGAVLLGGPRTGGRLPVLVSMARRGRAVRASAFNLSDLVASVALLFHHDVELKSALSTHC